MIKHLLIIFRIFNSERVFNILFFNPFLHGNWPMKNISNDQICRLSWFEWMSERLKIESLDILVDCR